MAFDNLAFSYPSHFTPEEVLSEIEVTLTKNNPGIGKTHKTILKEGVRSHKFAVLFEVFDVNTGEYHHSSLKIETYERRKAGWIIKDTNTVSLQEDDGHEISKLYLLLRAFIKEALPKFDGKYGVIKSTDYEKLKLLNKIDDKLIKQISDDPNHYLTMFQNGGADILSKIINDAIEKNCASELLSKLSELNIENLQKLNSLAGLSQLKSVFEIWNKERGNSNEEFWQQTFQQYSWVISQLFSTPLVLFAGKAYMGGKWIDNRNGNVTDLVFKNCLTKNIVLIEIKTPLTGLIGKEYRDTHSASIELTGACNQLVNYRTKLQREYSTMIANNPHKERFENFCPRSLLIIGDFEKELLTEYKKQEAFEYFRGNSKDVDIITFDELFQKVKMMIDLLEDEDKSIKAA